MEIIILYDGNEESAKMSNVVENLANLGIENIKTADTGKYEND